MTLYSGDQPFGQAGDWLMRTAKANPEALLVLAAGAAMLMRRGTFSTSTQSSGNHRHVYRYSDFDNSRRQGERSRVARMSETAGSYASNAGAYASDVKNRAGAYASDVTDRVSRAAGDYASQASDYAGQVQRNISDQASALTDYASDIGRSVADQASAVTGYAADMGRNISDRASAMTGYATEMGRNLGDQAYQFTDAARSRVQSGYGYVLREQPLAIAVLGIAAGAALAAMFPPTEIEAQAFGPAGRAISDAAAKVGENLMEAAGEAGERIKQRASERGLTPDGLKEIAQEAAGAFANKATGSSDQPSRGTQ